MTARGVTAAEAAVRCGLTVRRFKARVRSGMLPGPLPFGDVWDLHAIDRRLDELSGLTAPVPRDITNTKQAMLEAIRRGTA